MYSKADIKASKKLQKQDVLMTDIIDVLYKEGRYDEALSGLIILKKSRLDDDEFIKLITPLINCCIQKLR